RGRSAISDGPEFSIGSAPDNQLVLTDPTVSRRHCLVRVTPEGFLLRDLGSTNGTRLASFRVTVAYLKPGAAVTRGETEPRLDATGDEVVEPLSAEARFGPLLGSSAAMRRLFALIPRLATSNASVLIEGETGTGKTLLAEAIHQASGRARG